MAKSIEAIYKEIGIRILNERKRHGMSQERLASLSNVDRTHMGFIEQGRRRPTLSTLYKVTKALKISLEQLFKGL
jgi:transcriptional regulator with XRE-family HTH domain